MKKKLIIITTALILAMSMAGCGQKTENTNTTTKSEQTDASGGYENSADTSSDSENQDYSAAVDMDKIDGQVATSSTEESEYSGEVSGSEVSIDDAKLIEFDGDDVAVISFTFTNKTDSDQSFTGLYDIIISQNDEILPPATVTGVDGIELLSLSQNIAPGETIKVQKTCKVRDTSSPVTVSIQPFAPTEDSEMVEKTFEF